MTDIEKIYAQVFLTAPGQRVLEHLRKITIERVLGASATESELRTLEAQRALVHQITQLVTRGRGPNNEQ